MNGTVATPPPAAKSQLYDPNCTRPGPYCPTPAGQSRHRRCSSRRFCCLYFIYTFIIILTLLLLAAIAACVFYVLYHPKHPTLSIISVKVSAFKLSSPSDAGGYSHLSSKLDFVLTAKNPNNKISFFYDQFTVDIASSGGTEVGNATLTAFAHTLGNTTILRGMVAADPKKNLDPESASKLKSDLGKKSGYPLSLKVDTKVEVKVGKMKSNKVGIRVSATGSEDSNPNGTPPARRRRRRWASTSGAKCKVDLRIKIWRFTF